MSRAASIFFLSERKNLLSEPKNSPKVEQTVLVLVLLAALAGGAWANQPELLRLEKSADAMGSAYTVELYGYDRVKMEAAADAALDEARRLDEMLSNYQPESEWSQVNQHAAERPMKISPELFRLFSACLEYSRQSEGAFDITVGPLMKVWGFYKGTGHLPHRAEVAAALARVGYRHVRLDRQAGTVWFDRAGVELDPGGIGKGYAVDRMVDVLKKNGVTTALVAGSASSIYGMGAPPGHPEGWAIDIRDPWNHSGRTASVFLKDMSLSTSGSYEKFFRAEGRTYAHIMDPRTGYPAQGTASVSVLAPRTIDSEAWAKPYFVNGRQWAARHKPKDFRIYFCQDRTDQPCAWLP
jgi:thiamine biosynthesis lipoprotein